MKFKSDYRSVISIISLMNVVGFPLDMEEDAFISIVMAAKYNVLPNNCSTTKRGKLCSSTRAAI